ncbi:hypothetical protein Trydic_g4274 [Trypoxylus dichotomus]
MLPCLNTEGVLGSPRVLSRSGHWDGVHYGRRGQLREEHKGEGRTEDSSEEGTVAPEVEYDWENVADSTVRCNSLQRTPSTRSDSMVKTQEVKGPLSEPEKIPC